MTLSPFSEEDTERYYDTFSGVYSLIWGHQIHTGFFSASFRCGMPAMK